MLDESMGPDSGLVARIVEVFLQTQRTEEAVGLARILWKSRPTDENRARYVRALAELEVLDAQWDVLNEGMSLDGLEIPGEVAA